MTKAFTPHDVLDFWFPDTDHWSSIPTHIAFWDERMQGGMDAEIIARFAGLTDAAARGLLDDWAQTPRGRLALLIALDQFPRSLWRDTPAAFAQDIKACRLCLEGLENGHYDALPHMWERQFYIIAISHCEGPDHLARMDLCDKLSRAQAQIAPPHLAPMLPKAIEQSELVRANISRFGRHPHRNAVLGRPSTPDEAAYIETGIFPHLRQVKDMA